MPTVLIQNTLKACLTHKEDATMLRNISSPMNYAKNDPLTLKLVDICLDNTLQIFCKLLLCFAKVCKIDYFCL